MIIYFAKGEICLEGLLKRGKKADNKESSKKETANQSKSPINESDKIDISQRTPVKSPSAKRTKIQESSDSVTETDKPQETEGEKELK